MTSSVSVSTCRPTCDVCCAANVVRDQHGLQYSEVDADYHHESVLPWYIIQISTASHNGQWTCNATCIAMYSYIPLPQSNSLLRVSLLPYDYAGINVFIFAYFCICYVTCRK